MSTSDCSQPAPRAQPLAQFQQQTLAGHVPLMLANDTLARPYHSRVQYIQGTSHPRHKVRIIRGLNPTKKQGKNCSDNNAPVLCF